MNDIKFLEIPTICPICNAPTKILINKSSDGRDIKTLHCTNDNCKGKLLGKLTHFVSKEAMNIDGLSEATLEKFISLKLVNSILDIYILKDKTNILYTLDGFGDTSINNLITSIENSKTTTMERVLNSLSIPMVGKTNAKTLANYIDNDKDKVLELGTNDLTVIPGIGTEMNNAIHNWFNNSNNVEMLKTLLNMITIQIPTHTQSTKFVGLGFVITGKLNKYPNRDALQSVILHNGGTIQSSVSSNTNYLINNDINSSSSKNKKAKELNIPIISEDEFLKLLGNDTSATQELTDKVISGELKPVKTTPKTKKLF